MATKKAVQVDLTNLGPEKYPSIDIKLPAVAGRIGKTLLSGAWYEQPMLGYIRSLRLRGAYLDVGANIGNHSLYFAANTFAEKVFAFEPTPAALRILRDFVELNNFQSKIEIVPYACADFEGQAEVRESLASSKTPRVYDCIRIDAFINTQVALIKVDVEGSEVRALEGAKELLRRDRPLLFVEAHDTSHLKEISDVIGPLGYKATGRVWNASPTYEFSVEQLLPYSR